MKKLISKKEIETRLKELGKQITRQEERRVGKESGNKIE